MIDLPKYNFIGYEEEDKYHLFDEFAIHAEEQRKWLIHDLYYELGYVSLNEIYGAYLRNYVDEYRTESQLEEYYINLIEEKREEFLSFLFKFLQRSFLIVTVADVERSINSTENHVVHSRKNEIKYTDPTHIEIAIADIKVRWNKFPQGPKNKSYSDYTPEEKMLQIDKNSFGEHYVTFSLPEAD